MEAESRDSGRETVDVTAVQNETTFSDNAVVGGNAISEVDSANDCCVRRECGDVSNEMSRGTAVQQREAF